MMTENHEVIFAIVNSGYAEEVMDVARENGARGGTILNARGVAGEEAAAFFGITLHAEKEILMIVVEKSLRDGILNAIYKQMGMAKKAQGIAFSLPVSDVAGLVKAPDPTEE
ncbi:MAG: P-II family nitrogen regulator [Ruminococcaceae bacterium]|nr:P-II family nitrogen regulator [Oscillospiraceae bacterium]MBQ3215655.1 P-II family nitrogen regulator [Oscillospiraceae bacterium]